MAGVVDQPKMRETEGSVVRNDRFGQIGRKIYVASVRLYAEGVWPVRLLKA